MESRPSRLVLAVSLAVLGAPLSAADLWVSPDGESGNAGTRTSPWDLASTLRGARGVKAGDTVWLLPGTYRRRPEAEFEVRLAGTEAAPVHVRAAPGGPVTIDGGLSVVGPSAHLWVRDLEILVSENFSMSREIDEPGSHPQSYGRPWGGLNVRGGSHCKFINLVIHDCAQGISCWSGAEDVEIYGCLVHDNGWKAPDRGHGHAIYTQNRTGTKTFRHCILSAKYPGSYTMHAYGSARAYVDNYLVEENIAHDLGPFLIGGGRPSRNVRALRNVLLGVDMRIGYTAPQNEDCEVRGNLIVRGGLTITRFRDAVEEGNVVIGRDEKRPLRVEARWFPNRYDDDRAHLAVVAGDGERKEDGRIEIDAGTFLRPGDRYRLMDPRDLRGKPRAAGTCAGKTIAVPLDGEYAVFVVFRER